MEQFIQQLIEEKGLDSLDAEVLAQMKKDLGDRVEAAVNVAILEKMPPEHVEEFQKVVEKGRVEVIQTFCRGHIPDLDQVVANALMRFRQTYLGL
jgi:hypothetical protein